MRPTPSPRVTTAIAALAVTGLLAAGCSSSGNSDKKSSAPTSSKAAVTSKAAASPTVTQHPVPTSYANNLSKRKQVSLTKCAAVSGGWSASGVAKNPSTAPVSYTITVFFTTNGATVQDYARTVVRVPAGKSGNWTAQKQFSAPKPPLCVMTGVG